MSGVSLSSKPRPMPASPLVARVRRVQLAVVGPAGTGKRSLLAAFPAELAKHFEITESLGPAEGYLLACEAMLDETVLSAGLEALLRPLEGLTKNRGQGCEVGGLPVYVVLTKADRLANPGESHAAWLERIEELKCLASTYLEKRLPGNATGFGGVALRVWATAVDRRQPTEGGPLLPPFGVAELAHHAVEAARRYAAHVELQRRRAQAVLSLVLLVLVAMSAAIIYWAVEHHGLFDGSIAAQQEADRRRVDQALMARKLLDQATRLLSFADHRAASGGADWTRWRADADALREKLVDAIVVDIPDLEMTPAGIQLSGAVRRIDQIRVRAELLGLGEAPPPHRPALFHGPAAGMSYQELNALTKESYRQFSLFHRSFRPEPLPAELPLGVVHELEAAAQASIERFCEPVRREIRERVLKLGGGRQSLEAWQQLRDGWLAREAETELKAWRDLVLLLQLLDGRRAPSDPLRELVDFLRRAEFVLPLDEVELRFPVSFELLSGQRIIIRRATGPLELRHRSKQGEEIFQFETERERLPEYWLFRRKAGAERPARLVLRPGDEVTVQVSLEDIEHKTWQLTWSPADAASPVFAFEVLTRAPRLHAEDQPDPGRGVVAFGAGLTFDGADALRLPLLFPR